MVFVGNKKSYILCHEINKSGTDKMLKSKMAQIAIHYIHFLSLNRSKNLILLKMKNIPVINVSGKSLAETYEAALINFY